MRRLVAGVVALVLVTGASGCGDDEPDATESGASGDTATTVASGGRERDRERDRTPGDATRLEGASSDLGMILTDAGTGLTVYAFTPDSATESTCTGSCEELWPPLEGPAEAADELDSALLGTLERSDGSTQASYGGHPLYLYAGDAEPGDTLGQGSGGNWFVVGVDGELITDDGNDTRDGY